MYPDKTSKSAKLYERAQSSMPGGNSRYAVFFPPYPIYAAKGEGVHVTDVEGETRLDFVNNMTSIIVGHSHPKVVEAVREQSSKLMTVGMPTEIEIEYAELLCNRIPSADRIRFTNSGTEGMMYAIRTARAYTGKDKVARAEGLYHGGADVLETSQTSSTPQTWGPENRPNTTTPTGVPQSMTKDVITMPFNNVEAAAQILEENISELACVVVDPFAPRLAFRTASDDYLKMLREFTERHDIPLIFDEVMSFRAGYHGAQGKVGVTPDLTGLGKMIGGGLPVGAFCGKEKFMSVLDHTSEKHKFSHSGTYNANPLGMAAGKAAMSEMTPDAFDHIYALGERIRTGLRDILKDAGVPAFVQGIGSLSFMRIGSDEEITNFRTMHTQNWDMEFHAALHRHLLNNGVMTIEGCAWVASLPMTNENVDFMLEQVRSGVQTISKTHQQSLAS